MPSQEEASHVRPGGLSGLAARGAFVTLTGQGMKIIIRLVSVIILARLLTPYDYGLLAMIMIVVGVADVFRDFGLSAAAIQAKSLSRAQRDNLFWLNTALGVILTIVIFAGAPLLAHFFHQAELTNMTRALSIGFLLNGMATQYRADLNRRLDFVRLTLADVLAPMVALLVAIALAVGGAGYWALVAQQLTNFGLGLVLVCWFGRWRPQRWHKDTETRQFVRFGWNVAGGQLINFLGSNIDSLVIGARFGAGSLGLYNRGYQLLMTSLSQLRAPLTTVAMPVLARLQDERERFLESLKFGQLAMGYTLVAGLGLVVGAVHPVVEILLGAQWGSVAPIMRWLALAGVFQTLAFVGYWAYVSKGLVRELLYYTICSTTIRVVAVLIGSQWGVTGVAAGFALAEVVAWPLSFWWLHRSAKIPVLGLITNGLRVIGLSGLMAVASFTATWLLSDWNMWAQLGGAVTLSALVYAALIGMVPVIREDIRKITRLARKGMSKGGR